MLGEILNAWRRPLTCVRAGARRRLRSALWWLLQQGLELGNLLAGGLQLGAENLQAGGDRAEAVEQDPVVAGPRLPARGVEQTVVGHLQEHLRVVRRRTGHDIVLSWNVEGCNPPGLLAVRSSENSENAHRASPAAASRQAFEPPNPAAPCLTPGGYWLCE